MTGSSSVEKSATISDRPVSPLSGMHTIRAVTAVYATHVADSIKFGERASSTDRLWYKTLLVSKCAMKAVQAPRQ